MRSALVVASSIALSMLASGQVQTSLDIDFRAFKPFVDHEDSKIRRAAVLLLTEAILGEPQPHSGDSPTNARDMLQAMRATDLDVVFERCKAAWQREWKPERFRGPASQYEQLYRFVNVMLRMPTLAGFKFEKYIDVKYETLTKLALSGMALSFTPEYKKRLEAIAVGNEPMATWAKDALALRALRTTYSSCAGSVAR